MDRDVGGKVCTYKDPTNDYHIEAETKWTRFRRRHFQMHFIERKCMNFA